MEKEQPSYPTAPPPDGVYPTSYQQYSTDAYPPQQYPGYQPVAPNPAYPDQPPHYHDPGTHDLCNNKFWDTACKYIIL